MTNPAVKYDTGDFTAISASSDLEILGFGGIDDRQPEKRLMLAVLLDAVECYQKHARDETHNLFRDIEEWIIADDRQWLFSFVNICEAVDIDPKYLRNGLSQWKEQQSRKASAGKKFAAKSFPSKKTFAKDFRKALKIFSIAVSRAVADRTSKPKDRCPEASLIKCRKFPESTQALR